MLYKIDNYYTLIQTIFYFVFTRAILSIDISQFFYGFKYSHLGFIPNIFEKSIPDGYYEYAPVSYRLVNIDANLIRNGGFSLTALIILIIIFIFFIIIHAILKFALKKRVFFL